MEMEDGIPRRQPLFRTQSAQQVHKLIKKSTGKGNQLISNYIPSRSYDDLNINKSKPLVDLTVPACNSTMKIIDQMENLRFEQFDPVLTTTHVEHINEQANKKLNYSNEYVYKGLIDLEPNVEEIIATAEQQELQKRKQAAKFLEEYQTLQKKRVKPDIMELFDETTMIKQTTRINLKPLKPIKMKPKQATIFSMNSLNHAQTLWKI
ncbi:unnamed protein product [Adineta steineri]|uniref:Protein phosphatase 1 regulatory subunit 35 C-terminal domain-containing protein n=1 Tax=Adineta steineri TaxID=433720 RepID=A0A813MPQ3_9BILA|nr:unnamed protein product [Adineta steineri]CAF0781722.1 unnamed protein product [Adineta steineri]CAF0793013.1 unnamed protein product [Adineta steineri]CAF0797174.1 unnamed protein product [Adineta steineri]CAF0840498.1 unnamed protein product [Adineta steineri]